jgi:hypothetical protein
VKISVVEPICTASTAVGSGCGSGLAVGEAIPPPCAVEDPVAPPACGSGSGPDEDSGDPELNPPASVSPRLGESASGAALLPARGHMKYGPAVTVLSLIAPEFSPITQGDDLPLDDRLVLSGLCICRSCTRKFSELVGAL